MIDLAVYSEGDTAVSIKDIAKRQKLSIYFLEQVFRRLRMSGLVKSVLGPGGGYVLARPAKEMTLKSILHGVGEGTSLLGSASAVRGSREEKVLAAILKKVDSGYEELLEEYSLFDLKSE